MSAVSAEFPRAPANAAAPAHRSGGSGEPPSSEQDTGEQDAETKQRVPSAKRAPGSDFGPKEWLVDELYQQYQADPGSVDRAWWNFFADYHPVQPEPPRAAAATPLAPGAAQPPATAQPPAAAPTRSGPAPASAPPGRPAPAPAGPARPGAPLPSGPARGPAPSGPPVTSGQAAPPSAAPATAAPASAATATAAPATAAPATGEATQVRLRGAAARTAANMAASLTGPPATTVRAVPAKLLGDNRIVINNHLGPGRGGNVS